MPQTARFNMNTYGKAAAPLTGLSSKNYSAANAGDQIKTGSGVLQGFNVNTAGTGTTVTFYDGTSTSGKNLGTFPTTAAGSVNLGGGAGLAFTTGLFAVLTAGSGAANVTVSYQ